MPAILMYGAFAAAALVTVAVVWAEIVAARLPRSSGAAETAATGDSATRRAA